VKTCYLYVRGEYNKWIKMMQKAVDDAYAKGYIGESILVQDSARISIFTGSRRVHLR